MVNRRMPEAGRYGNAIDGVYEVHAQKPLNGVRRCYTIDND